MSTSLGYVVNSLTGESVPLERCLVVVGSGEGRPTVFDKQNGTHYQADEAWVFVAGPDDAGPHTMAHPSFRLRMMGEAMRNGLDLIALSRITDFMKPRKEGNDG